MPYKKLLLDVDGTLLDFDKSAEKALETLFAQRGYPYDENIFPLYEKINVGTGNATNAVRSPGTGSS